MGSTKDKKERKEKKERRTDEDGNKIKKEKKDKKDKKEKKHKSDGVLDLLENGLAAVDRMDVDGDSEGEEKISGVTIVQGALVPFANPLADEKATKKVYKSVKKATKHKALRRGVKEVVKSLRKSPTSAPSSASTSSPLAIVIIAADISPMDVISHIPVLCEDHNIPYIYVSSRAELGAAGNTKRPTSVVMLMREAKEDQEEWNTVYAELTKLVVKAGKSVKI